jgi:hypothetical protein
MTKVSALSALLFQSSLVRKSGSELELFKRFSVGSFLTKITLPLFSEVDSSFILSSFSLFGSGRRGT